MSNNKARGNTICVIRDCHSHPIPSTCDPQNKKNPPNPLRSPPTNQTPIQAQQIPSCCTTFHLSRPPPLPLLLVLLLALFSLANPAMADTPRKRPQCDAQRQSPSTSLAHRTRAPPPATHARRQTSPSSGPRDASAPAVSANAPPIHGANHDDDEDDEDYTSSSGSDSDSDGDGDGDGDAGSDDEHARRLEDGDGNAAAAAAAVPHISGRAKPRIHRVQGDAGLVARLSAFLPQMKTANEDLQREIDAGRGMEWRLDEADENAEGRYIEMVCLLAPVFVWMHEK